MRIVFMGVGALGSTAAVLCRSLKAELRFVDFDRVESKNLLAQAYVKHALGKNKAQSLQSQFLNFWGVKTEAFAVRCTAENVAKLCEGADLVVDCFDNAASRGVLSALVRANQERKRRDDEDDDWNAATAQSFRALYGKDPYGPALVHAGMSGDGTFGIIRWDERFAPDQEDQAGAATCEGGEHLPFIGVLAGALARVIQDFVEKGQRRDVMVSLGSITTTA